MFKNFTIIAKLLFLLNAAIAYCTLGDEQRARESEHKNCRNTNLET